MSERPQWTKHLLFLVSDEIVDPKYGWPEDGEADEVLTEIETAVRAILCRRYGHQIEDDQCGIPDHRYCVWCLRREAILVAALVDEFPGAVDDPEWVAWKLSGEAP